MSTPQDRSINHRRDALPSTGKGMASKAAACGLNGVAEVKKTKNFSLVGFLVVLQYMEIRVIRLGSGGT
jgi:hypothetical protein